MDRRQLALGAGALLLGGCATAHVEEDGDPIIIGVPPENVGEINGVPFEWINFSETGALTPQAPNLLQDQSITDFIVISHGWLTDREGAWSFYGNLLSRAARAWANGVAPAPLGRKYAILGVQWPSKRWGEEEREPVNDTVSADRRERVTRLDLNALQRSVGRYATFAGADPSELLRLAQAVADGDLRQADCQALMRAAMAPLTTLTDAELDADRAPYDVHRAQELMRRLSEPLRLSFDPAIARAQSINPQQRGRYQGGVWAIDRLFNFFTYYEMKARAGLIGRALADQLLPQLHNAPAVERIHLIGHSFGARLVTAACHHAGDSAKLRSLVLLQGAFSHNGLSGAGGFTGAYRKVSGPTLITHTHRDRALTLFYPIASLQSGDTSRRLGGPDDSHGAIGANGALRLGADAVTPAPVAAADPAVFTPGKVHNMNCDAFIRGHNDVKNANVARIVATALVLSA